MSTLDDKDCADETTYFHSLAARDDSFRENHTVVELSASGRDLASTTPRLVVPGGRGSVRNEWGAANTSAPHVQTKRLHNSIQKRPLELIDSFVFLRRRDNLS